MGSQPHQPRRLFFRSLGATWASLAIPEGLKATVVGPPETHHFLILFDPAWVETHLVQVAFEVLPKPCEAVGIPVDIQSGEKIQVINLGNLPQPAPVEIAEIRAMLEPAR